MALHREGRALVRLQMNFLQNQSDPALPELKERLRNQFQFFGDDMLMTGSIGEWAAPLASGAVWREAQRLVAEAGWRNENSVQNLAALTQVVEAYEAVNKEFDITRLRWMVHHVPEVTPDLLTRLKALGCGVQMGAFRWVTSTDPKVIVGPPFRTIVDHGIQVGIHGDGVHIAPLNPWPHIYFATTGINSFGARVNGDQQLTREEALRLFTRGNSWFLRMEDRIGSIETGKLADLVVLDRDYFTVPEVADQADPLGDDDGRWTRGPWHARVSDMSLSRRSFLLTTGAAFATPLDALRSRLEAGAAAPAELGYGPLRPVNDATTGLPLLELPEGFRYMTFGWTGDPMDDGRRIPPLHDGMAAFAGENGRVVLVRNHEIGPGAALSAPTYDAQAGGGTTTTVFDPAAEKVVSTRVEPCGHDPQLRGRADAVGIVADVRGKRRRPRRIARTHCRSSTAMSSRSRTTASPTPSRSRRWAASCTRRSPSIRKRASSIRRRISAQAGLYRYIPKTRGTVGGRRTAADAGR